MVYTAVRVEIDVVSPSWKEGYGGYEMPNRYVLRWERNRVLKSESGKEEHWLVILELETVLEKFLINFGNLFHEDRSGYVLWTIVYFKRSGGGGME